jgi:hypothetical protein
MSETNELFGEPSIRMTMLPRDTNPNGTIFGGNWLQVSAVTKLSEIDEAESNEFESEMTSLFGFIT